MTPIEAIKYFGIIKIENKNSKGEVTQTLLDFRFPSRCEHGHKTDATVMRAFANGILAVLDAKDTSEPKVKMETVA